MSHQNSFNEKSSRTISEFEFIHDPNDKYQKLGKGSFACVKLAKEKKTGTKVALKVIDCTPSKLSSSDLHNLRTEIHVHRRLNHPNIVKFHDFIRHGNNVYIILDFAENGNLYSFLHKKKILPEKEVFKYFYQTTLAIHYLHQNDILHRDIKPENLLLDKNLNIKLCDFGWSGQRIHEKRMTFCGTYEYMAPEIVGKRPYDYRVDVWSLGVLLYELFHREAPYKGRSLKEISISQAKRNINFSSTVPQEAKELVLMILKHDPQARPSIDQILQHPWVKKHAPAEDTASRKSENIAHSGASTIYNYDKRNNSINQMISPKSPSMPYLNTSQSEALNKSGQNLVQPVSGNHHSANPHAHPKSLNNLDVSHNYHTQSQSPSPYISTKAKDNQHFNFQMSASNTPTSSLLKPQKTQESMRTIFQGADLLSPNNYNRPPRLDNLTSHTTTHQNSQNFVLTTSRTPNQRTLVPSKENYQGMGQGQNSSSQANIFNYQQQRPNLTRNTPTQIQSQKALYASKGFLNTQTLQQNTVSTANLRKQHPPKLKINYGREENLHSGFGNPLSSNDLHRKQTSFTPNAHTKPRFFQDGIKRLERGFGPERQVGVSGQQQQPLGIVDLNTSRSRGNYGASSLENSTYNTSMSQLKKGYSDNNVQIKYGSGIQVSRSKSKL